MINVSVYCPNCKEQIDINDPFNEIYRDIECDNCGYISQLQYEESYDEDEMEEIMMFWLE